MKRRIYIAVCAIVATMASCNKTENLFSTTVVTNDGKEKVQFVPNMKFQQLNDSSYYYFTKKDYIEVMGAEILKGESVYKDDNFDLRVVLYKYSKPEKTAYKFVLRTFSKDFKIIDSYIMSSTNGQIACDGKLTNDLEIITTCSDGTETIATISEYGKFKVNE